MAATALGLATALVLGGRSHEAKTPGQTDRIISIFAESDSPMGGEEISKADLATLTKDCGVCTLPDEGEASLDAIDRAWSRSDGKVAIDFASGLRLYFTPDSRSNEEYVADAASLPKESDAYSFISLRGAEALARVRNDDAPSALLWAEDGRLVEMIGYGGQELADLVATAEELGKA
jgi:hypothetical protein